MPTGQTGTGCLDCCEGCDYATDDFNRADGAMGANYTLLTGTAPTVLSNELDFSAAGFIRHNTAYPGAATESRRAIVKGKFSVAGTVDLAVGLTDANNYYSAKLLYAASGCHQLTAAVVSGGIGGGCTPTVSVTSCVRVPGLAFGEQYALEACLIPNMGGYGYETEDKLIVKVTLADGRVYSATIQEAGPAIGSYTGLRSTVAHKFDDLKHTYFRNSPEDEHRTCPNCNTPCLIGSDDFTTDEPCNWQVIAGSYSVAGGVATMGATNSKITFNQFHPGLKTSFKYTVDAKDNGAPVRLFHGNGYAVLTYSSGTYTLTLYDNDGVELDEDEWDATADSTKWLAGEICYSRGVLSAQVTGHDGIDLCVDAAIAETEYGYWASLGGDSGTVFDNFVLSKTYDTTEPSDAGCDDCTICPVVCDFCEENPPAAVVLDLTGTALTERPCSESTPDPDPSGCEGVGGEYLLIPEVVRGACGSLDPCARWYVDDEFSTHCCHGGEHVCMGIFADIVAGADPTKLRWRAGVGFNTACEMPFDTFECMDGDFDTSLGGTSVIYYSEDFETDECHILPRTLTKSSELFTCPCGGTFPDEAELSAA